MLTLPGRQRRLRKPYGALLKAGACSVAMSISQVHRFSSLTWLPRRRRSPSGMTSNIRIGSIVRAKLVTRACFLGEVGVCYGVAEFEGEQVYGFIFETGRFIVLYADDVMRALNVTGRICEALAEYNYAGDEQLKSDFRAGRFTPAFPLPWRWLH